MGPNAQLRRSNGGQRVSKTDLKKQTVQLCKSLPGFASAITAADRKGSGDWEIVRWVDIGPDQVHPTQESSLEHLQLEGKDIPVQYPSRTQALRASAAWVRSSVKGYSESGHWGVWRWQENGR